jgi:large subunit ribosomal protein L15
MPLQRRMPKRGFKNINRKEFVAINLKELLRFEVESVIDSEAMVEAGLIKRVTDLVKILGVGELDKKLIVQAQGFSHSAKEKIEKAGGQAQVVAPVRKRVKPAEQEG